MTTKRTTKGFTSMDLVLPVAPYYRTDPQVMKDVEILRTNAASRWARDEHSRTYSRFHNNEGNSLKFDTLAQPRVEILRANSPTLKRLLAARAKLERLASSISRTNSPSRQSIRSTPYPRFHEKNGSTISNPAHISSQTLPIPSSLPPPPPPLVPAPPPSAPVKTAKSSTNLARPLDKITYEKTWSLNGNLKQKCSLEIWLPKPGLDEEEDRYSSRGTVADTDKIPQVIPIIGSRRPSVVKIAAITTVNNAETKSIHEETSKNSEPMVVPRVYHYGDYIMDLPDERPRSSKSVTTVKSDSAASMKTIRRQHPRSLNRRLSTSTHHSEEILRFGTVEVHPSTAKAPSIQSKSASAKPNNPVLISELMQKYSLIKKNHQELTQTKLQLEKPTNDSKSISSITKDQSPRSRPPPIPEPTLLIAPDRSTVPTRKLPVETSTTRSIPEQTSNTNPKLLERRSTPHKPSNSDIYPHLRIFSIANQRQHRQSSASVQGALLPNVSAKKIDEPPRLLQRSKTLDVVLDVPMPVKSRTRVTIPPDTLLQPRTAKRPSVFTRPEQQFQRSATTIPNNSLLIRFSQGNNERNYLVPE